LVSKRVSVIATITIVAVAVAVLLISAFNTTTKAQRLPFSIIVQPSFIPQWPQTIPSSVIQRPSSIPSLVPGSISFSSSPLYPYLNGHIYPGWIEKYLGPRLGYYPQQPEQYPPIYPPFQRINLPPIIPVPITTIPPPILIVPPGPIPIPGQNGANGQNANGANGADANGLSCSNSGGSCTAGNGGIDGAGQAGGVAGNGANNVR
jgi:hypothetical protein